MKSLPNEIQNKSIDFSYAARSSYNTQTFETLAPNMRYCDSQFVRHFKMKECVLAKARQQKKKKILTL